MKLTTFIMTCLVASTALAQEEIQSGIPARLTAVTGKAGNVFLQSIQDGRVTFELNKSPRPVTVPADKISRLEFITDYDEAGVKQAYDAGDYAAVLGLLEPIMADLEPYMMIVNNMQDAYAQMMESYRGVGNWEQVRTCASVLMNTKNPLLIVKGQVNTALALLHAGDIAATRELLETINSESARLYTEACVLQAEGKLKEAIKTAIVIIQDHANDVDWMAATEYLIAGIYLDMEKPLSAFNTARQVKNIYAGTPVAGDAAKLHAQLSAEVAAAEAAKKAEIAAAAAAEEAAEATEAMDVEPQDLETESSNTNVLTEATGGNE